jgi:hypothetical protein
MRVYIDVTNDKGTVSNWNLELTSPNTVRRQGWGPKDLLPGEKVIFEAYAGKVVETRGALAKISKAETPDKPLFIAGGPEQPGFPKQCSLWRRARIRTRRSPMSSSRMSASSKAFP